MNVPIREAADVLGVAPDTIRRRIRTGVLRADRDAQGRWIVELPDEQLPFRVARYQANGDDQLEQRLQGEMIDVLREQLSARTAEVQRLTGVVETLSHQQDSMYHEVLQNMEQNRRLLEQLTAARARKS